MSITTLFLAVIASIVVWFFLQQRLLAKPWLEEGPIDDGGALSLPTAKLGLRVFLAVVTVLFMLLIMAYGVRMALEDWRPAPQPKSLVAEHGHAGLEQRRDAMGADCITSRRS